MTKQEYMDNYGIAEKRLVADMRKFPSIRTDYEQLWKFVS